MQEVKMGSLVDKVVNVASFGLIDDLSGAKAAAEASQQAASTQAGYEQRALDYLMQQEELPSAIRGSVLPLLASTYGVEGYAGGIDTSQAGLISQAKESPLYAALLGGQQAGEESILRQAGATGGLRSGNVQSALSDYSTQLQNQALLQSYGEQKALQQQQLGGLSGLAQLPSYATQIAGGTAGVGQTLGQGIIGSQQSKAATEAALIQQLAGVGQTVAAFSDIDLKENVKYIGEENGYPVYTWKWNKTANAKGLYGYGNGVIADDLELINPDAVILDNEGFKKVRYDLIGVNNA
jgi:hypothetical protein